MTHLETPHSFWSEDPWVAYQVLFQFSRVNTPGEMTDIGWYTKYLIDGDTNEVDLDELVRENERIRVRLSLLTGVEVGLRRIRWKKIHWRNRRTTDSSSQSSPQKKKREYRPLVRNLRTNKLNQFLKPPGKPIQNAPPSSETLNGFEARLTGENFEARPPPVVKHLLRPISLRNVHSDEVASRSSGPTSHSHFDEKSVIRYSREHSREEDDVNKDWHRHNSAEEEEGDDEAQKSPVAVSDLVSKFESVRRRNAFSYGSSRTTKNFDPYSSLERKKKSSQEENQRRSIRVILHNNNSPPVDQMDSRMDGISNQSYVNTTHEAHKTPQRSSGVTRSDAPFLRMKSEGHSRVYPAKLGGITTTDQFSHSPSEPKPLQKGYSFDSGFRIQQMHPVVHHNNNPPMILTNDHLAPPVAAAATTTTTHNNHISVVTKLPAIRVDGTNIRRTHSASKGDEPFHKISSRSSFNKNPDAARQITCSVIPETDPVPSWKSEVEIRKRTKSYVASHKPEQPMQLGSVPEWKKMLLEKNKQKRNSTEIHHDLSSTRVTKPETNINYTEPAWKLEFDKIKRQVHATHQSNHYAANVFDREIPEWVKLAEQRRQSKPFSENEEA